MFINFPHEKFQNYVCKVRTRRSLAAQNIGVEFFMRCKKSCKYNMDNIVEIQDVGQLILFEFFILMAPDLTNLVF